MTPDITVKGGSAKQRSLLFEAAHYYLERLLPDNYQEITLLIRLKKNHGEHKGVKGSCVWEDDRDDPSEFEIILDSSMCTKALLRYLAHECVHCKQYFTQEMCDTKHVEIVRWKGVKIDMRKVDYYDHPWEIDAYGREEGLYQHFVKKFKYTNKQWNTDRDYK